MLHYDMVRFEIMYLRTLDELLKTDNSLLYSSYDTPEQFRDLITWILEQHFVGDKGRINDARKKLKYWADLKLIDKEYFECFKGTPRATWFAHHYIFEYPILPPEVKLGGLGSTFPDTNVFNSLLMDPPHFENLSNFSLDIAADNLNLDFILKSDTENPKKPKRSFSRFYLNSGASTDSYNPSPVTEREQINGVMRYIDNAEGTLDDKISYFRKLHECWLDQYNFFLRDFEWMSRDDENQLLYLWDYLQGKNKIAGYLRPYNTSMRYDMMIAAIDVWNVSPDEKLEFIEKMKHAWQASKSYKKSKK
ncbi:TPA: hypothetical protein ACIU15_003112 [Yersinia enterocolitica]|nr:hypothetical protein [Yersinia enterocolitica]EKN4117919.1 hypothetical protein [Yersinia enterocolitica]EKN4899286.1 hypothetical protein [Yersinia enterocolitica]EKN6247269.1 hypothetical protein [Yersinia enterocolitica]EKN6277744.1 hypothetical protein [Yersinia enterocolitica]